MIVGLRRAPACVLVVLWVSVSAFAPEIIWQGFLLLGRHFGAAELYTAMFIGAMITFFVEPLSERLKAGHWRPDHGEEHGHARGGSIVLGALLSFLFGVALVCVHEAMAAYFAGAHGGENAKWVNLARALAQALEWASAPAAVTAAWLLASLSRRLAYPALGAACVWVVAAGFVWDWSWPVMVTTSAVACLVALLGTKVVIRSRTEGCFTALAGILAITALACIASMLLVQAAAGRIRGQDVEFYTLSQAFEDLRFYLGWCLGLCIAPDPTLHAAMPPRNLPAQV